MERKDFTQDTLGYEEIIQQAFPNALIERVSNFDDATFGWLIVPTPTTLIRFRVSMGDGLMLYIDAYVINHWECKLFESRIYHGCIPPNSDSMEPDFEFLKTLLKNYIYIG